MSRCGCQSEAGRWTWGLRSPRGHGSGLAGRAGTRRALRPQGSLQPWKRSAWKQRTLRPPGRSPPDPQGPSNVRTCWVARLANANECGQTCPNGHPLQTPLPASSARASPGWSPALHSVPPPTSCPGSRCHWTLFQDLHLQGGPAFLRSSLLTSQPSLMCAPLSGHSTVTCSSEVQDTLPYSSVVSSSKSLLPVSSKETYPAQGQKGTFVTS